MLVRTPGADKDVIVDGHHHFLATEAEGHPVWSYVGRVSADEGPWDEKRTCGTPCVMFHPDTGTCDLVLSTPRDPIEADHTCDRFLAPSG